MRKSGKDDGIVGRLMDRGGGGGLGDGGGSVWRTLALGLGALVLVLLAVLYFVRPWLHPLVYGLFVEHPAIVQWTLVAVGLAIAALFVDGDRLPAALAVLAGVVFVGGLLLGVGLTGAYTNVHLAEDMEDGVTVRDSLLETRADVPRILPEAVAREYAQNSLQFPRHTLGTSDITFLNGTPHWSYGLKPDGIFNTLTGRQAGAVYVDMTTRSKRVRTVQQEFQCGQGQLVTDDYRWQLRKSKYFAEHTDPFVVSHEGQLHIAVPYVIHDFEYRWTPIPQPYTVPEFGGVALVDTDCNVRHLPKEEALDSDILAGQNVYPYSLARERVNAMQFKNGILNAYTTHRDQLEIADLPNERNQQPFTVLTAEGITYVVAAEPWGEASGIYQIWTLDARTGDASVLTLPTDSSLLGPQKAANFVEQDNPRVNWGSMSPSEPIPVVRNGDLYWEVRVVPDSAAGITYTAFVNAETSDVVKFREDDEIVAFLSGEDVDGTDITTPDGTAGGDGGLVVVIVDENGTPVRTVPVGDNQSIRIQRNGTAGTATG